MRLFVEFFIFVTGLTRLRKLRGGRCQGINLAPPPVNLLVFVFCFPALIYGRSMVRLPLVKNLPCIYVVTDR